MRRPTIRLKKRDQAVLKTAQQGKTATRIAKRARILVMAAAGRTNDQIAGALGVGSATVKRVKARYRQEGAQAAVTERPRPGRQRRLSTREEQTLIAQACVRTPDGAHMTVRMLAAEMGCSFGVVQKTLKQHHLKPWREKNVVHSSR